MNIRGLLFFAFSSSLALISLTACYRMPTDDDFSVVPTTNNPAVTHEKPGSLMPGVGY